MRRPIAHLFAVILVGSTLAGCASSPATPPTTTPTTASASPTEAPSPPTPSAPADAAPQQVVGLSAMSGGGSGEVELRWTPNPEADVVSYVVRRASTAGGMLAEVATVTSEQVAQFADQPFIDEGVAVGYYRVSAVDSAGQEGAMSDEVCGASPIDHC